MIYQKPNFFYENVLNFYETGFDVIGDKHNFKYPMSILS